LKLNRRQFTRGTVRPLRTGLGIVAALSVAASAWSQAANVGPGKDTAAADRATREANKVFQWILIHGDKARKVRDEKTVTATAAARPAAIEPAAPIEPLLDAPPALAAAALEPMAPVLEMPEALLSAQQLPALRPVDAGSPKSSLELISSVEPEFPPRLVQTLGAGAVVVRVEVATDGRVARSEVLRSPHKGLNPAALAAVAAWRFKAPAAPSIAIVELKFE
jgi:TonB family protein